MPSGQDGPTLPNVGLHPERQASVRDLLHLVISPLEMIAYRPWLTYARQYASSLVAALARLGCGLVRLARPVVNFSG